MRDASVADLATAKPVPGRSWLNRSCGRRRSGCDAYARAGALRPGGHLRPRRRPGRRRCGACDANRPAGARGAVRRQPQVIRISRATTLSRRRARRCWPRCRRWRPRPATSTRRLAPTIGDLSTQVRRRCSPSAGQERRRRQGHGELSRSSSTCRMPIRSCGPRPAPAWRPESRVRRARAHGERGDAARHAGRGGDPPVLDAAQGLSELSAQRPGALPAGARLRDHGPERRRRSRRSTRSSRAIRRAAISPRCSSAAASCCSRRTAIAEAQHAYEAVLARGRSGSTFYAQSLYKHGWSQFKQGMNEDSLQVIRRSAGPDPDRSRTMPHARAPGTRSAAPIASWSTTRCGS